MGQDRLDDAGPHCSSQLGGAGVVRGAVWAKPGDDVLFSRRVESPPSFVDEAVVETTEGDEVVDVGLPSVDPVLDVVAMHPTTQTTSREPTALVSLGELAGQPWWDAPVGPPDPNRLPITVSRELPASVASQAAGRLVRDRGCCLDLGGAVTGGQGVGVDVDDHGGSIRVAVGTKGL